MPAPDFFPRNPKLRQYSSPKRRSWYNRPSRPRSHVRNTIDIAMSTLHCVANIINSLIIAGYLPYYPAWLLTLLSSLLHHCCVIFKDKPSPLDHFISLPDQTPLMEIAVFVFRTPTNLKGPLNETRPSFGQKALLAALKEFVNERFLCE